MRALLVYDASIRTAAVLGPILQRKLDVVLFPLLEDEALRGRLIRDICESPSSVVDTLDSARLVERQVNELCACAEWSASLGASQVNGRSLKEHLLIPGFPLSAWWLGHISERNPLKTSAFLCMAQLAAVRKAIAGQDFEYLIVGVGDPVMRRSLALLGQEAKLHLNVVSLNRQVALKQRLLAIVGKAGTAGEMLRACYTWAFFVRRSLIARFVMRGSTRCTGDPESSLFVSHFPAVDNSAADDGVFRNKYFLPLQELMAREGRGITWLLLYVPIYGYSFREACVLARRFSENGERLTVLEECLSVWGAFAALALWLRISTRAIWLYPCIDRTVLYPDSVGPASEPIVRALWRSSHCGPTAIEGLLYLLMFRAYVKQSPSHKDLLYFFENYPLEKALLSVGRQNWPKTRFLAYQHTTIPRNLFPYFCSHRDTRLSNLPENMPLPDHVIANGRVARSLLTASAFPGVVEAEAIRYFYIERGWSEKSLVKSDRPTILIAGSHDRKEMLSTARLVKARIDALCEYDVWVKGHPGMPLGPILWEAGIHPLPENWRIRDEDISLLLPQVWAVLVPASTVAVEALAWGCEVICPVFPDVLGMNPLSGHEEYYHRVYGAQEFSSVLTQIMQSRPSEARRTSGMDFIRAYWNLDQKMPLWLELLFGQKGAASGRRSA
jgi:surface carbohydrate biosynthesis protein (TIGR04326 family)